MGAAVVANSKLAKVVAPALDKVVKNAAWRKHGKLVQDCKAVMDKFASLPEAAAPPTPRTPAPTPAEATTPDEKTDSAASSDEPAAAPPAPNDNEGPLFDDGKCYSAADAELILLPLFEACDTLTPKVVEPALDCIQKLIAHGHLRGEMDVGNSTASKLLLQAMESVCKCYDMGDDGIELLVLKTLLTAVTSSSLRVHGDCLLKAVRTCYNIFLGSKSPVNQSTAKASLTQMLVIVFRRMEADSSTVPVHPIVVADLMEPAERSNSDSNVTQFVQGFITKVVQDIEVVLSPMPPLKTMKHDGAFEATASESSNPTDILESTDKDMLDAKYWEISMYKNALDSKKAELAEGDVDKEGDVDVQITNKLRRDAFLVFRALCKLSMKNPPQEGVADPFSLRGKIVALELLKILLENAGAVFRTSDRFLGAIKQYLCLSLLKNIASPMMNVFQLSCSIFMSLVSRFRAGLKAEIGVFFPMIVLRVLENVAHPNFQQKMIVLRFLEKLCVDPQILVDIFVNYDCDVDSSNIFERMVNGLLKTAQGVPPGAETTLNPQMEGSLKLAAIKCLVGVLRSMGDWLNRQLRLTDSPYLKTSDNDDVGSEGQTVYESAEESSASATTEPSPTVEGQPEPGAETSEIASIEQRRAYKLEFQEGISLFNKKPRKGVEFLIRAEKLGSSAEEVAAFLLNASGLDKTMIGDYLGEKEDFSLKVMHAYVDSFNFEKKEFDEAIRSFLLGFRLPGEAQKIDRIMEKFAERYCKCNPKAFTSADTAYVLAYSVIMLNTDAHNPMVKSKMSKAEFIRNNRGIDDGKDLPEDFMSGLYDRIVTNEIKMKADTFVPSKQPANNRFPALDAILNIVIRKPREFSVVLETSDDVIRHMQEQFKAKTGKPESVYYAATDVELLRPMVDVTWAPMLAAFSVPLDKSEDEVVTFQCLEGFRHAIHITSVLTMKTQRDAFITSLAKFTSLHSAADIKQKNIDAIKAIISVADEDGNYLQEAWEHILTCVSRFEHLHLIGEGAPPDATFFAAPQTEAEKRQSVKTPVLPVLRRKGGGARFKEYAAAAARRGSYDSAGVGGGSAGVVTTEQMNNLVSNLNMLEQIGSFEMNKIFTRSQRLNSEAIVDFVKALCKVSMEELRSPSDPRVFSLTKIVEIAHFNMSRIRLVWSRIWHVLADFFVTVGCSDNLSVAMYAMDSLRQLAMKFLEREELANYNFQNEFMKPFVIVMRKSSSVEIRELIIRCVSQMVFARVGQVKSGWKIMFMVFTTAATDDHKTIVLLAFETIEKIVREYFPYITETETTTFTDCVNCLIAFTNSRFNSDVSLNAIAFLRFCALKLAEGELGATRNKETDKFAKSASSSPRVEDGKEAPQFPTFTDKEDHLYFWFPLLAGLSELTFDPRPDIRKSALEVLFDTLRYHGHLFSPGLWEKVFDSVLFPIFDYVRRATEPAAHVKGVPEKEEAELEMDAWLYETCTLALQLVVDLFVKFYPVVNPLLDRILSLLTGFIKRPHQSLAAIGVAAFVRLMSNAGNLFSDERWQEVLESLLETATETLPDMDKLVACAEEIQAASLAEERLSYSRAHQGDGATQEEFEIGQAHRLQMLISDVRCRTAVQLLLVQAITEMYTMHGAELSAKHTILLLDTLHRIAGHSYNVNGDHELRIRLQQLRMATQMPDPPLLRLENESYHAYLAMLQRLGVDKPELAKDVEVEARLVVLCEEVLNLYVHTSTTPFTQSVNEYNEKVPPPQWVVPLGSARRRELMARAPLVVATLQAVSALKDSSFERYLVRFFPLLAGLISCEHGSGEVQLALSDMFSSWIGPILLQA